MYYYCFLFFINGCTGYKPIFGSSNLPFKIDEFSLEGDKSIGNKIYSNLYNLSKSNNDIKKFKIIKILIEILQKEKKVHQKIHRVKF